METDREGWKQRFFSNWLWLCPAFGVAVAAGVLIVFGFSFWTAVIAALLLVCPALIVWGIIQMGRNRKP